MLELDPVLMEQVLFNISGQCRKVHATGTEIRVSTSIEECRLILRIYDEGGGIPFHEINNFFEKFYRVETTSWKPAGTGTWLVDLPWFCRSDGWLEFSAQSQDRRGAIFQRDALRQSMKQLRWHRPCRC